MLIIEILIIGEQREIIGKAKIEQREKAERECRKRENRE